MRDTRGFSRTRGNLDGSSGIVGIRAHHPIQSKHARARDANLQVRAKYLSPCNAQKILHNTGNQ